MLFEIGDILILNKNGGTRYWIYDYSLRNVFAHNSGGKDIEIGISTLFKMLELNQVKIIKQPKNQYAIMGREQITIEEVIGGNLL